MKEIQPTQILHIYGNSVCFNHKYELPIFEAIEIFYLTWKSEQKILTPKYDILRSFVPLVTHYCVVKEDDKPLKINCLL